MRWSLLTGAPVCQSRVVIAPVSFMTEVPRGGRC
jgi:hypothetical protein